MSAEPNIMPSRPLLPGPMKKTSASAASLEVSQPLRLQLPPRQPPRMGPFRRVRPQLSMMRRMWWTRRMPASSRQTMWWTM